MTMIGMKLRQKKSQVRVFVVLYGLLGLVGCGLAALSVRSGQNVSGAAGFMMIFGFGMAANALIRGRKAQVSVHEDFVEVHQSRTPRTLRYRNMTAVSRPDKKRLVVTLREDGGVKNEVVWLKELDPIEVDKLHDFLVKARGKRK
jgi:hypothetical protein